MDNNILLTSFSCSVTESPPPQPMLAISADWYAIQIQRLSDAIPRLQ